jgi:hypothetical protein
MQFEADAFISYAHLDNLELVEGRKGWVANLQRALAVRVAQMLGKESRIWWDRKLCGNDDFDDTLIARLQRVALLVSVVSPRYVRSEWGRKEILAFCQAATEQGGIEIQDKCRLFKVLKTQVPLDQHPPELQSVLGYEFFKVDPETGKPRELNEIFGPEAERDFWIKLDDLAHDMCGLLEMLERRARGTEAGPAPPESLGSVYLAVTTADAKDERAAIKRELEQHGYRVLPDRPLPSAQQEVEAAVRADLAECRMSIHLVGKTYGVIPEGGTRSLCEIQNELAIVRGESGGFSRLVWIEPGLDLEVDDDRQHQALERIRNDPRILRGADVLETPFEDLRTLALARLRQDDSRADGPAEPNAAPSGPAHVYLIHDQRDTQAIAPWADFLFTDFEVIGPAFDGDEADARAYHEENLRIADGVVIFYGAGSESWLRRKVREVQKSAGYGRTKPEPEIGICLIAPRTPEKERFRTHKGILLPQWDGLAPDPWQPFVARLKGGSH